MIPFAKPLIGPEEKAAVLKALDSPRLTEGPLVEEFERAFGEMHGGTAIAVSSCTAALEAMSYRARRSVTVITAMTHVATAHALISANREVRFVDCDENGQAAVEDFGVSFMGAPTSGDMLDCATAVGWPIPESAYAAAYSFYPSKHMTTGEGGMIVVRLNDYDHYVRDFRRLRAFGKSIDSGKFDVVNFGLNFRMSEIAAAIGIEQLKKLPGWLEIRKRNWHVLADNLPSDFRVLDTSGGAYYALAVYVPDGIDRDGFRVRMLERGVETSVYYPVPVPHLTYYRERYGHKWGEFPNAERIATRSVCFPCGPHVGDSEIETIIKAVKDALALR